MNLLRLFRAKTEEPTLLQSWQAAYPGAVITNDDLPELMFMAWEVRNFSERYPTSNVAQIAEKDILRAAAQLYGYPHSKRFARDGAPKSTCLCKVFPRAASDKSPAPQKPITDVFKHEPSPRDVALANWIKGKDKK